MQQNLVLASLISLKLINNIKTWCMLRLNTDLFCVIRNAPWPIQDNIYTCNYLWFVHVICILFYLQTIIMGVRYVQMLAVVTLVVLMVISGANSLSVGSLNVSTYCMRNCVCDFWDLDFASHRNNHLHTYRWNNVTTFRNVSNCVA